ncbi:hypothetical protein ACRPHP_16570 [Pantoea allii]|uniref:hypothetical protein n=1 Tax=Pantoea allii TaxID=574096 RepID=UPI003D79AEC3
MQTTNNKTGHKRNVIIGSLLLLMSVLCIIMTIIFVFVSNKANERIDGIRADYQKVAERRDRKVSQLADQVQQLQKQISQIPDKTADKTADKVNQVVKEDEAK